VKPFDHDLTAEEALEELLKADRLPEGADDETRALFEFVKACRQATQGPIDTGDLVDRALAISTREDLSLRGDIVVVSKFVRDRLRSSPLLRLAAASLLIHLAALPVVALYVLTEEPTVPEFSVDLGDRAAPYSDMPLAEDAGEIEISDVSAVDALLVENTLRWSRWQLDRSRKLSLGADAPVPAWIANRYAVLYGGEAGDGLAGRPPFASQILEVELILDRHLVSARGSSFSGPSRAVLDEVVELIKDAHDPDIWLAAAALARAESYGLSSINGSAALSALRAELPLADPRRPLLEVDGDVRRLMPLDPLWLLAVREAGSDDFPADFLEHMRALSPTGPR